MSTSFSLFPRMLMACPAWLSCLRLLRWKSAQRLDTCCSNWFGKLFRCTGRVLFIRLFCSVCGLVWSAIEMPCLHLDQMSCGQSFYCLQIFKVFFLIVILFLKKIFSCSLWFLIGCNKSLDPLVYRAWYITCISTVVMSAFSFSKLSYGEAVLQFVAWSCLNSAVEYTATLYLRTLSISLLAIYWSWLEAFGSTNAVLWSMRVPVIHHLVLYFA